MHWRVKAGIQRVVAAVPGGDTLHYGLQRCVGSLRPGRHDPRPWFDAAARMTRWLVESGRDPFGKRVLEVGTGRSVDLPLGLWLCGAGQVLTVDLNRYLSPALVAESLRFVRSRRTDVAECFGAITRRPGFDARLEQLARFEGDTAALLRMTRIDYRAPADATCLAVPAASIDVHVSYAVLEHVPPAVIPGMLAEARRVLAPGGMLVHVIDPSDHFAHDDGAITTINFLRYGEREWQALAGNKFAYHNRLRAQEHRALFATAGAQVVLEKHTLDERALRALRDGFPVHPTFRHIAPEQLAVRGITLVSTFEACDRAAALAETA